jgi:tellurite resistance protein TerC
MGLSVILAFVGVKMLITFFDIHIPIGVSLGVIGGVLVLAIIASLIWPKREEAASPEKAEQKP